MLADSTFGMHPRPFRVSSPDTWTTLAAGGFHTCAVSATRGLSCWGRNTGGQLGTGYANRGINQPSFGGGVILVEVSAGQDHTCGMTQYGEVMCWGSNSYNQIGERRQSPAVPIPYIFSEDEHFEQVEAYDQHTCVINHEFRVRCFGRNVDGTMAVLWPDSAQESSADLRPLMIRNTNFVKLGRGVGDHTCGFTPDRRLFCWGANEHGQVGPGPEVVRRPQRIWPEGRVEQDTTVLEDDL
jgi:alpha-tubulin suppressor-like RCC1 family protein